MSIDRRDAEVKLEGQRSAIREHIEKFNRYEYLQDKDFAVKTIRRCQENIRNIKNQCNVSVSESWEDTWVAPYYSLNNLNIMQIRELLLSLKEELLNENKSENSLAR